MANNKNSQISAGKILGGLALASAAGAIYLFGTKQGTKNRKKIRGWYLKAKGEVMDKLEKVKEVDKEIYFEIVESVLGRYRRLKDVGAGELSELTKELKGYWENIKNSTETSAPKKRKASTRKRKTVETS